MSECRFGRKCGMCCTERHDWAASGGEDGRYILKSLRFESQRTSILGGSLIDGKKIMTRRSRNVLKTIAHFINCNFSCIRLNMTI